MRLTALLSISPIR